jgi:hypothetical protein
MYIRTAYSFCPTLGTKSVAVNASVCGKIIHFLGLGDWANSLFHRSECAYYIFDTIHQPAMWARYITQCNSQ